MASVAITGKPQAIASTITKPKGSSSEARANTSACDI